MGRKSRVAGAAELQLERAGVARFLGIAGTFAFAALVAGCIEVSRVVEFNRCPERCYMANLIVDPSHETGDAAWQFLGTDRVPFDPRTGSWHARQQNASVFFQTIGAQAAGDFTFSTWVKSITGTYRLRLNLAESGGNAWDVCIGRDGVPEITPPGGPSYSLPSIGDVATGYRRFELTVALLGTGAVTYTVAAEPPPPTPSGSWYVDDHSLERVPTVAITKALRNALKADLDTIPNLNVYDAPRVRSTVKSPAAIVAAVGGSEGGTSEPTTISNRGGIATQLFSVDLTTQTGTPIDDVQDLLDDVRNAIEDNASNLWGTGKIQETGVESWELLDAPDDADNQWITYRIVARAVYHYTRGSA